MNFKRLHRFYLPLFFSFFLLISFVVTLKAATKIRVLKSNGRIVKIDLEKYLLGVLAAEVPQSWPPEMLKAQAVASRSFALKQIKQRRGSRFDLRDNTNDQVYKRVERQAYPKLFKAVKETAGEILLYRGKVAEALFHAACGGHTAAAKDIFGEDLAYLQGVDCPHCQNAPRYFWRKELKGEQWKRKIKKLKHLNFKPASIAISKQDKYHRVLKLILKNKRQKAVISSNDLRQALGFNTIRSNLFEIRRQQDKLVFLGSGSGHGVGMCQWGGRQMAKEGKSYRQILAHYYPQTTIGKVY